MIDLSKVKSWVYPGGEVGIRVDDPRDNQILARIQNSDDLMKLIMYIDGLSRSPLRAYAPPKVILPYLPYARQDRVATAGDPFAAIVFGDVLTGLSRKRVRAIDIHSDKAALAANAGSIAPTQWIGQYLDRLGIRDQAILVAPDKGARDKTHMYAHELLPEGHPAPIVCNKVRDPISGKLFRFEVTAPVTNSFEKRSRPLVITDDICDGGGTFHGVYEALRTWGFTSPIHLWTTHGIYSKGTADLLKIFETIGCADTFRPAADYAKQDRHHIIEIDYQSLFATQF